jgi:hypothetical protein
MWFRGGVPQQLGDDAVVHVPTRIQAHVFQQPAVVGDQQQRAVVAFEGFLAARVRSPGESESTGREV